MNRILLQLLSIGALAGGTYYGVQMAAHYQQNDTSWYSRPEGKSGFVPGSSDRLNSLTARRAVHCSTSCTRVKSLHVEHRTG
jgi:hypothetical protein